MPSQRWVNARFVELNPLVRFPRYRPIVYCRHNVWFLVDTRRTVTSLQKLAENLVKGENRRVQKLAENLVKGENRRG